MTEVPEAIRATLELALVALRDAFGERLRSVALFGSHARRQATAASDIDLAIVLSERAPDDYGRVSDVFRAHDVEPEGGPFLSIVIWCSQELRAHPWLLIDVATDGVVLLDDGELGLEMNDVRCKLDAHGAKRVLLEDGSWYWDLKPDWKPGEVIEI